MNSDHFARTGSGSVRYLHISTKCKEKLPTLFFKHFNLQSKIPTATVLNIMAPMTLTKKEKTVNIAVIKVKRLFRFYMCKTVKLGSGSASTTLGQ